ncbi:TonB-dependent siderophore receptor [Pandoraea commovens]|uniref:TonB-dependent siderophore receptor n=1 Tax=Pandoraea commovens TaxID=2508289 RepID=A0ABY5QKI8_9BURK|nr:TonB-dependent siderophore receptor [Pandoraea commovens]UVA81144.1 TonB-dependent siderophore receptor [Pandoraea commovens]
MSDAIRAGQSSNSRYALTPVAVAMVMLWAATAHAQTPSPAASSSGGGAASAVLPAANVTAQRDAQTEGSTSYGTQTTTIGKTPQALKDIPNSVSVVTRARMDDQAMTSVADALQFTTGITAVNYGDGTYYFNSRGYNVGVEFDGVSILSGIQYQPQFDLSMYDRVEVFRGPAGLLDGTGEPGGTVNLVRKRPGDTFAVRSETTIGSWANYRQMIDVTGPLNQSGTIRGRAVLTGDTGNKSITRTSESNFLAYGALEFDLTPRTLLSLSGSYQVNPLHGFDYGQSLLTNRSFLDAPNNSNFSPDWNYSWASMQEVNGKLEHRFDNDVVSTTTVNYRHVLSNSKYAYLGPGINPTTLTARYFGQSQRGENNLLGIDSHLSGPVQAFGRKHEWLVGMNYQMTQQRSLSGGQNLGTFSIFSPPSNEPTIPFTSGNNLQAQQFGVYGQARVRVLDPLTVVLGGREAWFQQQSQSLLPTEGPWNTTARANHKFIPYGGVVLALTPQINAYFNYSKIFAPQTATTFDGQGLPPREGQQYELGVKGVFLDGRLSATVAAFRMTDTNRAVADPFHAIGSVAAGSAQSQGWEAEVTGQVTRNWNVYAGYTLLNTRYNSDPSQIGQALDGEEPQHLFKLYTTYRFSDGPFGGVLDGLRIGGGVRIQSSTYRTVGAAQGGYAVWDAMLAYRVNRHLEAQLNVNNVFNRDYYARVPSTFYGIYGERRNVMLTLRADY